MFSNEASIIKASNEQLLNLFTNYKNELNVEILLEINTKLKHWSANMWYICIFIYKTNKKDFKSLKIVCTILHKTDHTHFYKINN